MQREVFAAGVVRRSNLDTACRASAENQKRNRQPAGPETKKSKGHRPAKETQVLAGLQEILIIRKEKRTTHPTPVPIRKDSFAWGIS